MWIETRLMHLRKRIEKLREELKDLEYKWESASKIESKKKVIDILQAKYYTIEAESQVLELERFIKENREKIKRQAIIKKLEFIGAENIDEEDIKVSEEEIVAQAQYMI